MSIITHLSGVSVEDSKKAMKKLLLFEAKLAMVRKTSIFRETGPSFLGF